MPTEKRTPDHGDGPKQKNTIISRVEMSGMDLRLSHTNLKKWLHTKFPADYPSVTPDDERVVENAAQLVEQFLLGISVAQEDALERKQRKEAFLLPRPKVLFIRWEHPSEFHFLYSPPDKALVINQEILHEMAKGDINQPHHISSQIDPTYRFWTTSLFRMRILGIEEYSHAQYFYDHPHEEKQIKPLPAIHSVREYLAQEHEFTARSLIARHARALYTNNDPLMQFDKSTNTLENIEASVLLTKLFREGRSNIPPKS